MAYIKNTWVDQDVERPKTYEVTNNQDGSITLTDSFGLVTELGTPVNADNMNHIEQGIFDNSEELDTKVNKSGDTMTGYLIQQRPTPTYFLSSTQMTKGTNPDDIKYMSVNFNDEKGNVSYEQTRLGLIEYSLDSNGLSKMRIAAYRNLADSTSTAELNLQINSSGTASCTFPNTTCCDGQWVNVNQVIATDVDFNTGGVETKTYSLASYLPNDNYTYEVLFALGGQTAATSGASFSFALMTDIVSNVFVCRNITRSNAYVFAYGAAIVPLNTRQIRVIQSNTTGGTPTMSILRICAYRRVGTNA